MAAPPDPYRTLGVSRSASDAELRSAYRRLVLLHHPDHNGGSAESTRRFEEIQDAYAAVRRRREASGGGDRVRARPASARGPGTGAPSDPGVQARLAAMERELKAAREASERAARKARLKAPGRPSDEDLGYFSTDDSFSKILDDLATEVSDRFGEAKSSPAGRRVADLIDELGSKLTGEPPDRRSRG